MSKPDSLSDSIDAMLSTMMKEASDPKSNLVLEDRLKIIDRALKKKALDHKIKDSEFGSAFDTPDE